MLIDNVEVSVQSPYDERFEECFDEPEREVRLEPDISVSGALAFRLTGNRTRGVFICCVNHNSKQSEILHSGDQILQVNGVNVRRLTCDQIASILRLSVHNNGYALLYIGARRQSKCTKDGLREMSTDENSNLRYYYPFCDLPHNTNNSILPTSRSDMTGLGESTLRAQALSCSLQYSEDLRPTECLQLICFDEISEQQFSFCKEQKTYPMYGYMNKCNAARNWASEGIDECSVCSEYSTKRRWHLLKHQWATTAMKLLPKSASDFFGRRIYQKAYYNLI